MRCFSLTLTLVALVGCSDESEPLAVVEAVVAVEQPAEAAPEPVDPKCPESGVSEAALDALKLVPADNTISVTNRVVDGIGEFLLKGAYTHWCHDIFPRTNDIRMTGPYVAGFAVTTHARVRVYYSEDVVDWLKGGRQGAIQDGAMIVKQMHAMPVEVGPGVPVGGQDQPTGWALMVRDAAASHDGWLWYLFYLPHNQTNQIEFESVQYGLSFCVSCHASSDGPMGTFSFLGNLENRDVATYVAREPVVVEKGGPVREDARAGPHGQMASMDQLLKVMMYQPTQAPNQAVDTALLALFQQQLGTNLKAPLPPGLVPLPEDAFYDHVVAAPGEQKQHFFTGDACAGCHDASNLLNTIAPAMTVPLPAPIKTKSVTFTDVNASVYGEWSASMMALSSRDPVFRAQFEWELANVPSDEAREAVSTLCLSCHGAMGERRFPDLAKDPANYYAHLDQDQPAHTPEEITAATYGALVRDGVSCTVCHHISADGLGDEKTFTAKFETGPAEEIYGPFDDVKTHPMQQALGVTPTLGTQIQDAALCGSCHTVNVPVYDGAELTKHVPEQTTYKEWVNSTFATAGAEGQTCQQCHMPGVDPIFRKPMATKIANIEDTTFPYVPNRANSDLLDTNVRNDYRRHTLVGLNVFVMSMFQQFPLLLGSNTYRPNRAPNLIPPKVLALQEAVHQASVTAGVAISDVQTLGDNLLVSVDVKNLAGHKMPSGVGFRRAFLELSVEDAAGKTLWCSGCTNDLGVIVGGTGQPLPSEFATTAAEGQPDFATIVADDQVQIYETRHTDCQKRLTTSFVHLCDEVKDNRLLPDGWSPTGKYADETAPVAIVGPPTPGGDSVRYEIPTSAIPGAANVKAALYYQSIPPYYLIDRFRLLADAPSAAAYPETERLLYLILHLDVEDPKVAGADWKLALASATRSIGAAP